MYTLFHGNIIKLMRNDYHHVFLINKVNFQMLKELLSITIKLISSKISLIPQYMHLAADFPTHTLIVEAILHWKCSLFVQITSMFTILLNFHQN